MLFPLLLARNFKLRGNWCSSCSRRKTQLAALTTRPGFSSSCCLFLSRQRVRTRQQTVSQEWISNKLALKHFPFTTSLHQLLSSRVSRHLFGFSLKAPKQRGRYFLTTLLRPSVPPLCSSLCNYV